MSAPATESDHGPSAATPFFGSLPAHGPWTALGLGRTQFLAILGLALALFVFVDGPVWRHVHASHFIRITVSYAVIPLAVAAALAANRRSSLRLWLAGTVVLSVIKLIATAGMLIAVAML